ncbi:NUDIX domain-containing protein, partial [Cephalotus follicularis]
GGGATQTYPSSILFYLIFDYSLAPFSSKILDNYALTSRKNNSNFKVPNPDRTLTCLSCPTYKFKGLASSSVVVPPTTKRPYLGPRNFISFSIRGMSSSTSTLLIEEKIMPEVEVQKFELLSAAEDIYGGVTVDIKEPMDSIVFASLLKASMSKWRQQGKKGVWIKLPTKHANLVQAAIEEGFRYHHAEPDYLMLAYWIPETSNSLPANASHRVGIGAFVMNSKREVLVVQEKNGHFKGSGIWKLPTGVVDEGEDICAGAIREVKEETSIDTEFVEVLAFRQSHKSFFRKSDLLFICMLRPLSTDIRKQDSEIEAAQWMPIAEYAAQAFVQNNENFNSVAKICLAKSEKDYACFSPMPTFTTSGKRSYLYFNNQDFQLLNPGSQH